MKITYSAAASLDGFIAREDGDVSWLDELHLDPDDTGLQEFFDHVDGLVMGRNTWDFVFDYGTWPYEDKLAWVCTSRELQPLDGANLGVVDNINDVIEGAAMRDLKHLWLLGGGDLASSFLEQHLMTHISISEMPVTLGAGIPLFARHKLEEIDCIDQKVTRKSGFRLIEMTIRNPD